MKQTRKRSPKLGELLERRGRIDRERLFGALRHQRAHGGRLGTCLLELELVEEEELLHLLSEQARLPFAEIEDLRSISEQTLALLPPKVAVNRLAIPLRASGSHLSVAMRDPHDIAALDEVAFVSGKRVRPLVASEIRILEALARFYDEDIPSRFVQLLDRLNRARYLWQREQAEQEAGSPAPGAPPGLQMPTPVPAPTSPDWTPAESPPAAAPAAPAHVPEAPAAVAAPPAPTPAEPEGGPADGPPPATTGPPPASPPAAAPRPATTLAAVEQRLREPAGRNAVGAALMEFAAARSVAALLLIVRRNDAIGWLRAPEQVDAAPFDEFRLALTTPSLVLALREGVPYYRGPLPPLSAHREIAYLLGPAAAGELLAVPLKVRGRMVAALIAASSQPAFAAEDVDQIRHVCDLASIAFELLVLRQKLQHT